MSGVGHPATPQHVRDGGSLPRRQPRWLTPKAIRLNHLARLAERIRSASMLVMQKHRKLRSDGFALGGYRLFKQMVLNILWQVAPDSNNRLAQRHCKLIRGIAGDRIHRASPRSKNWT